MNKITWATTHASRMLLTAMMVSAVTPAMAENLTVLIAVDVGAAMSSNLALQSVDLASKLSSATGQQVTLIPNKDMKEVLRATRTSEFDVIVVPGHAFASAALHGYKPVGLSEAKQKLLFFSAMDINEMSGLKGRRLYLPPQDSFRTYIAKGVLAEAGISLKDFKDVKYGASSGGGLSAIWMGLSDVTIADEKEVAEMLASNPKAGHVIKETREYPTGLSMMVKGDLCESLCPKLQKMIAAPNAPPALVAMKAPGPDYKELVNSLASLGIATPSVLKGAKVVGAEQVSAALKDGAIAIDTRSKKEFERASIPGAKLAAYLEKSLKDIEYDSSLDDFSQFDALKLDTAKPVIIFCNGPECWKSFKASNAIIQKGYKNVLWFRGGIPEWKDKGLPLETKAKAG